MNKISRIVIRNYRGIEELDATIPPSGAIVKGTNGKGKTTVLKAIRAALAAQDIGPDAIRNGADKAEILVDIDKVQSRRSITKKGGGGLTVTQDLGDGIRGSISSPQSYLTQLLGTSPLDPIDLFLAKPKERRAKILAALPVSITIEQLRKWVPKLPDTFNVEGHGLEVLERVRKAHYDARTEANANAKRARAEADRAKSEAEELAKGWNGVALPVDQAETALQQAKETLSRLDSQFRAADASDQRTAATRAKVADLRSSATELLEGMTDVPVDEIDAAKSALEAAQNEVERLEHLLAAAKNTLATAEFKVVQLDSRVEQVRAARKTAAGIEKQADDLEAAVTAASVTRPTTEEHLRAKESFAKALEAREDAEIAKTALDAKSRAEELAARADEAIKAAAKLDDIVDDLTNKAPAELLASSNGIPGLTLDGEDIFLDGVHIERGLSGREQLRFALEIARRANARSKILVVDKLECIAPDQLDDFVREATAGDYQLIASRVDRGDIVLEAIASETHTNGAVDVAHA